MTFYFVTALPPLLVGWMFVVQSWLWVGMFGVWMYKVTR